MMTNSGPAMGGFRTLADRLTDGRMPTPEALRYAMLLGEALCKLHGSGQVHGAVAPESVVLSGEGIDLTPSQEGHTADVATDILGFGGVLYEMLTGRKASSGGETSVLEPTGITAADRLIACCLAEDPSARPLNMQKVLLELRFVALATRHSEVSAATRRGAAEAGLRAEMQQLEDRLVARLEEHEQRFGERAKASSDVLNALTTEFVALKEGLATTQKGVDAHAAHFAALQQQLDGAEGRLAEAIRTLSESHDAQASILSAVRTSAAQTDDLVGRVVAEMLQESTKAQASSDALNVLTGELVTVKEGLAAAQQGVDAHSARFAALETHIETVEVRLAEAIRTLSTGHDAQASVLAAVRTSAAQTDDLVGRLVEAMETLQDSILDPDIKR